MQKYLDVRLLAPSENETEWDVFILGYNVDGSSIKTVNTLIAIFNLYVKLT